MLRPESSSRGGAIDGATSRTNVKPSQTKSYRGGGGLISLVEGATGKSVNADGQCPSDTVFLGRNI